jgi:hypothetical protein
MSQEQNGECVLRVHETRSVTQFVAVLKQVQISMGSITTLHCIFVRQGHYQQVNKLRAARAAKTEQI